MTTPGMVITFRTTAEGADQFAGILERALPFVEDEQGTTTWIAGRSADDPTTFYLVDLFTSSEAVDAHMAGQAAALILGEGGSLLAEPPAIGAMSLLAGKFTA